MGRRRSNMKSIYYRIVKKKSLSYFALWAATVVSWDGRTQTVACHTSYMWAMCANATGPWRGGALSLNVLETKIK